MNRPGSDTAGGSQAVGGAAATGNATLVLVLGIVGIVCCCLPLGPVVWYLGRQELQGIAEGRIAAANEGVAKAGMILGIICTALGAAAVLAFFLLGGLAMVGALVDR